MMTSFHNVLKRISKINQTVYLFFDMVLKTLSHLKNENKINYLTKYEFFFVLISKFKLVYIACCLCTVGIRDKLL